MARETVKRAFKFRFYPTDEQAAVLCRTFGCVRLVYNKALEARTVGWSQEQRRIGYAETSALLTGWKRTEEMAFLNEVSCVPLQQALRHVQSAFVNFWEKRARYPKFKSRKKSKPSAEYTRSAFSYRDGKLRLAKMADPLDIVWSRPLPKDAAPSTVTVSRDCAGRWFVSILCEDASVAPLPAAPNPIVGIDAGITSLMTLSTGEKIGNPRHEKRDRERLARSISDAAWSELRSRLEYKCQWYGRKLVMIERFYPSSKTCSACGHQVSTLPLSEREWRCPACGACHDRDANAARNIQAAGLAVIACGAGVRPQRNNPRGHSASKQETQRATAGIPSPSGRERSQRLPSGCSTAATATL